MPNDADTTIPGVRNKGAGHALFDAVVAPMLTHKYGSGAAPWRTVRGSDEEHWRRAIADVERSLG